MAFISATQLTALRTVAYRGLDTEVVIERPTQTETDFGSKEEWAEVATTLAWIREMSSSTTGAMLGMIGTTEVFRIHVAHDIDVRHDDRITVGDSHFTVTSTNSENTIRIFTTAVCRRVE